MNLEDYHEICLGHLEGQIDFFVDHYRYLIPERFRRNFNLNQLQLDLDIQDFTFASNVLLPGNDLLDTFNEMVDSINSSRQAKEEGQMQAAWSAAMRASRLYGRLQPVLDYDRHCHAIA